MKVSFALIPLSLALTACGPDATALAELGDADASEPIVVSGIGLATSDEVPAQLNCVSEVDREGGHEVLRVELFPTEDGPMLNLRAGLQFPSHERGQRHEPDVELRSSLARVQRTSGGLRVDAGEVQDGVHLELARDGLAFHGTLVVDACYTREARALTCWDPLDLFSGFGGPAPGRAAFDFAEGRCLDDQGRPALNRVPVELVRETGMGDCADLRGVKLNGDDFGYPQLSWWSLRGADLRGAELFFADLVADFRGADLSELDFGYATLAGSASEETRLPEGCEVPVSDNPWAGPQLDCAR